MSTETHLGGEDGTNVDLLRTSLNDSVLKVFRIREALIADIDVATQSKREFSVAEIVLVSYSGKSAKC